MAKLNGSKGAKSKGQVTILLIREYKGYQILLQKIGNLFQFIIYYDHSFYQGYNDVDPQGKKWSKKLIERVAAVTFDHATSVVDLLINKENPDKLLQENPEGAAIADILERANKSSKEVKYPN